MSSKTRTADNSILPLEKTLMKEKTDEKNQTEKRNFCFCSASL